MRDSQTMTSLGRRSVERTRRWGLWMASRSMGRRRRTRRPSARTTPPILLGPVERIEPTPVSGGRHAPSTDYTDEEEEEELDPYDLPLADRVELLVEDNQSVVEFAMARVTRWTARAEVVDASCRFGAYRHVDHRWLGR